MNFRIKNHLGVRPPGGWIYRESVGHVVWDAPDPMGRNFSEQVQAIRDFRKANGIPEGNPEQDLHNFTAQRLNWSIQHVEAGDADSKKNFTRSLGGHRSEGLDVQPAAGAFRRIWERIKHDATGVATLYEWMAKDGGEPVAQAEAERRARLCTMGNGGNPCVHNVSRHTFEAGIARKIQEHVAFKRNVGLSVSNEIGLKTCNLCGCHLPLKVWVPEVAPIKGAPAYCWARSSKPAINVHRGGAFGDVVQASTVADALCEYGYDVHFIAGQAERVCLEGHPSIASLEQHPTAQTIELDWAYENSPDFAIEHIQTLFHRVSNLGLTHKRVPQLRVTEDERAWAQSTIGSLPKPVVGIIAHAGAWPNRQTNAEDWGNVAKAIPEVTFVNLGPHPLPQPIRTLDIIGFRKVMALIEACDLICSVDTGPMHVASALRKRMVVVETAFRIDLRLTDGTDYLRVPAPVECVGCMKYKCEKFNPEDPPCRRLDIPAVTAAIRSQLSIGGVSAIVPTMGKGDIRRCDKTAGSQVAEILFALDGNTDKTQFAGLSIVDNPDRVRHGFGKTCNRAARLSRGKYLLFLNDDCYLDEWAVFNMLKCFQDPKVAVVGCKTRYPDGKLYFAGSHRPKGAINYGHIQDHRYTSPVEQEFVNFAAAIVRRDVFFSVGGFDERYDCYAEDADLCLRVRKAGWKVMFTPDATGIHDESRTTSPTKMAMLNKANELFDKRWREHQLA